MLSGVVPEMQGQQQVKYLATNINTAVAGATANFPAVKRLHHRRTGGSSPAGDDQARERFAVLGSEIPNMLNANPAALIHQTILIRGIPFEIIGIMATKGVGGFVAESRRTDRDPAQYGSLPGLRQ